jgi:hypothetical protein
LFRWKEGGKRAEKRKDVSLPLVGKKRDGKTGGGQFSLGPTNCSLYLEIKLRGKWWAMGGIEVKRLLCWPS